MSNKTAIKNLVRAFLEKNDLQFIELGDTFILHISIADEPGLTVFINCKELHYSIITKIDVSVPEEARNSVMKYLTCANYGMSLGNFEFDQSDGEIHFRVTCDMFEELPSEEDFALSFLAGRTIFSRYSDGLMEVINGADTIETCESIEGE